MSTDDQEILSATYVPGDLPPVPPADPEPALLVAPPRRIPNFGHTVLFFTVAIVVLILASVSAFAIVMGLHLMGRETPEQLLREPRLLIPSMAIGYLLAGAIVWAVFTYVWQQPFTQGLRWNFSVVRRRWRSLLAGGVVLSLVVQFLSNFLPIPKTLPIDDFFRTPGDVWMVALFGTLVAPVFEELAFRGFLLPSLASAWDWLRGSTQRLKEAGDGQQSAAIAYASGMDPAGPNAGGIHPEGRNDDPRWSIAALAFSCTLTSIGFALVHADQLAHAWAPLAVLFAVSLVLCGVRLWTQSLAASTLIHATYNGTIFTILFFATGGFRHLDKIN
jgi:membrane protease YdiL (CAAX protease family)